MFQIGSSVLFVCALFVTVCHADVRDALRYNRFQRQELSPTPYPAAGYRPERQFPLPAAVASGSEEDALAQQPEQGRQPAPTNFEQVARPDATYGAPARLRQFAAQSARQQVAPQQPQQVYSAPQVTYGAPVADTPAEQPARLTAAAPAPAKSARLSADPEERDTEIDDAAEEVDVTPKNAQPKAVVPPQAATVAYFPAGAVGFVQPVAAKLITKLPAQYQTAAYFAAPAAYTAAPAAYANAPAAYAAAPAAYATQPQFYAPSAAFLQPQFGAFAAAPAQLNAAAW